MRRGRVISFDSPEKKAVSVFPTHVVVGGSTPGHHALQGHPYKMHIAG
jgi:hypothetical protein